MNGVDVADQLRCYYDTQRVHFKTWKPLWHYLLDTTICNSYKIAHTTSQRSYAHDWNHYSHKSFRDELARELFSHSERLTHPNNGIMGNNKIITLAHYVKHVPAIEHGMPERLDGPAKYCVACTVQKRSVINPGNRKPFQELNPNSKRHSKRRIRPPCIVYGCKLCGIHLCKERSCWEEHSDVI